MKTLTTILFVLLIINQGFSQITMEKWKPVFISPTPHNPGFKSRLKSTSTQSFYKQKDKWQDIIDSIWGPGQPLNEKLNIFDTYTQALTEEFDGFISLGINETEWDSIKNSYRSKINDTTSRGAFAGIMSHLAYNLYDIHTYANDKDVLFTPLNPGTPLLHIGSQSAEHFGAVLTPLPDSTLVVLRTVENHTLDLQPGDIVLGYEGIPWKDLIDELLDADIPIYAYRCGAKSAARHNELISAKMHWHLFDTIDIVKYTSGDTIHLSVAPLLDLPVPTGHIFTGGENLMMNSEQLPVPGVPFPDAEQFHERAVTYGIIEGTDIGYIYMYAGAHTGWLTYSVDPQFNEAVSSLIETDGLIIDLRLHLGGWAEYKDAEALLFNQHLYTIEAAYRCNTSDFSLCPAADYTNYEISGNPNSIYDRPIAVLTGPNCGSMGDATAYYLGYHPMVHFFGKTSAASMGYNRFITDYPEWELRLSKSDAYIKNPGIYLNRREFPVDVPVWFNADDVANGMDPVVQSAMEWMQNLSYAHDVSVEQSYIVPGTGTTAITAQVENPNSHSISVKAYIKDMNDLMIDSTIFFDDGNHNDGDPGDGIWGALCPVPSGEETYLVSVSTEDNTAGILRTLPQVVRFTTIGPVIIGNYAFTGSDIEPNPGDRIKLELTLKNNSTVATATDIGAGLVSLDPLVSVSDISLTFGDIAAGENSKSKIYVINISEECPGNTQVPLSVNISSNDYVFWKDIFSIYVQEPVNIEDIREPITRIYPNPTDNMLNIEISNTGKQGIEIEIITVTGTVIYQKEYKNINAHFVEQLDLSGYTKGIYLVKIKQTNTVYVGKVVVR